MKHLMVPVNDTEPIVSLLSAWHLSKWRDWTGERLQKLNCSFWTYPSSYRAKRTTSAHSLGGCFTVSVTLTRCYTWARSLLLIFIFDDLVLQSALMPFSSNVLGSNPSCGPLWLDFGFPTIHSHSKDTHIRMIGDSEVLLCVSEWCVTDWQPVQNHWDQHQQPPVTLNRNMWQLMEDEWMNANTHFGWHSTSQPNTS